MNKAVVGALVAINLVLVALAVVHVRSTPPVPEALASVDTDATPAAVSDGQVEFDFKPHRAITLDVNNEGTVVYALRGICDGKTDARLWISTDGGAEFAEVDPTLDEVSAVSVDDDGTITLAGGDADCTSTQVVSTDDGATFAPDTSGDDQLWHVEPGDPERVVTSDGTVDPGCSVISLIEVGEDFARAACPGGTVFGTGDGGDEWVELGRLDNIRAMTFASFTRGYALARYQGCAAQSFSTDDGGRTWRPGSCITGEPARAIAANDSGLGALVDDVYYSSDDGGADFTAAR